MAGRPLFYFFRMWLLYAGISAASAAAVAIFGKLAVKNLDPTLGTTIRAIIMALFLLVVSAVLKKFNGFSTSSLNSRDWLFVVLAGVAGAVSWLFYFLALKTGDASRVAAVDRLSVVFVVIFASLFLGETLGSKSLVGAALMTAGAVLILMK